LLDTGIITYDPYLPIIPNKMPITNFYDPVFGVTDARIYSQFTYSSTIGPPDFKDATLDSAMLFLAVDTVVAPYGSTSELSTIEVYRMTEPIKDLNTYRSGYYTFGNSPGVLGQIKNALISKTNRPRIPEGTDTITYEPNISFRLTDEFGHYILGLDTTNFLSDSIFRSKVMGFMFKQANQNVLSYSYNISNDYSKLLILYTKNGTKLAYSFPMRIGPRLPYWVHDYPMTIKESINSETKGKELIYLQSLAGLKAKIRFTNLNLPLGAIINKAELQLTVITLPQDVPSKYGLPSQLALFKRDSSGADILTADQGGLQDFSLIGGRPVSKEINGVTVNVYTLNISNHIQKIVSGKEKPEVYIAIAPDDITDIIPVNKNLSRVVLGGPNHPLYPMKLKISFTTF
jgi:hypothetical protein